MKRLIKLPSVANVAAGASCSVNCPIGPTYERILLTVTGTTVATNCQNIEVRINGKPVMRFRNLDELDKINTYHGRGAAANGVYSIWFRRPELPAVADQLLFALGTADVATLSVHADLAAGIGTPTVTAHADINNTVQPLGIITKVKAFPCTSAALGEVSIDSIPRTGARIACLHFENTSTPTFSNLRAQADGIDLIDATPTMLLEQAKSYDKAAVTGWMHADFIVGGDFRESLRTDNLQDLRFLPTIATAIGAYHVTVEYIDRLEGI